MCTEDLVCTGNWVEVPLVQAFGEDSLEPPLRVFEQMDSSFSIKVWSEEAAHPLVDPPADDCIDGTIRPFLIQEALNSNRICIPAQKLAYTTQDC